MSQISCFNLSRVINSGFQGQFQVVSLGEDCLVLTPFLNADLAPIEIYLRATSDGFRLSDEGETLSQLFLNGLPVEDNAVLTQQVKLTAQLYDVDFDHSELSMVTTTENLPNSIHRLANAAQAIGYLIYKKGHRQKPEFNDEVERLLSVNQVRYEPRYSIKGYANSHLIPFYINSGHNILLETLTASSVSNARTTAKQIAYKWLDLQRKYSVTYNYAVLLCDKQPNHRQVWEDEEARNALENYSTYVLRWSTDQARLITMARATMN